MTANIVHSGPQHASTPSTEGVLYCALTGKPVKSEEAYWAPPLVTTRELVSTFVSTLLSAPSNLGHILLAEQPNVPYSPDAKVLLAQRRSTEQAKMLFVILLVAAVIFTPVLLLAMR